MANTRSHRNTHSVAKTSSGRKPQQRKMPRLFQNTLLTALFGRSVGTLVTRIVLFVAVIGALAVLGVGLLHPGTAATGLGVGNVAPDFTLTSLNGKQVSLSQFRGKPVMLNFWYSTCPGCLAEIPGMQRFYAAQRAAGKDFVILGVNSVDDAQTAQQFAQQYGLTYSLALDDNQQVATLYHLTATPTSYFIDRQGIIRATVVGPVDESTLQQDVAEISQT
jgi:cytochrome c biogenesis protein CcmG/thiol:disulfide interchange protein DsbE